MCVNVFNIKGQVAFAILDALRSRPTFLKRQVSILQKVEGANNYTLEGFC